MEVGKTYIDLEIDEKEIEIEIDDDDQEPNPWDPNLGKITPEIRERRKEYLKTQIPEGIGAAMDRLGYIPGKMDPKQKKKITRKIEHYIKDGILVKSFPVRLEISRKLRAAGMLSEASRYIKCGAPIMEFKDQAGAKVLKPYRCELAICPFCARIRGLKLQDKYREVIKYLTENQKLIGGYTFKMITLTYSKEWPGDFVERIKQSQKDIKNFWRRIKYDYRPADLGMISSMEISPSYTLHFHIIFYGPFILQKTISQIWYEITGDSFIVDIRRIDKLDNGLSEVLKYATKLNAKLFKVDQDLLVRIQGAIKRTRRILVYGIFYGKLKFIKQKLVDILLSVRKGTILKWVGFSWLICDKGVFYLEI